MQQPSDQQPVKDPDAQHPVAPRWRPAFCNIVSAFIRGDYGLAEGVACVAPLDRDTAEQIKAYVADYGETLIELPEETWATSVAQWMRTHWDVLVDLWTLESGPSDMVLSARVFEVENGFRIEVDSVHVP